MTANKTALVTGSTSGIGLGIAEALAGVGYNVMLNGSRAAAEAEPLRARIASTASGKIAYRAADMARREEIEALISATRSELGHIDVLVNNAGIQHVAPVEEFPDDKWDALIAVNLSAAFHATKHVLAEMKERKWGRIINIASAHSLVASPYKSAYVAAKHGLLGLTRTVALEAAPFGVTCNAVCPGYVLTPLVERQIPDQARSRGISEEAVVRDVLLAAQATKQFVTVEELGAYCVFLCSNAARSITGAALPVDGGWTAH